MPVERVQLKRPLQDVEDRGQQRRLEVHGVEGSPFVDQIGEAAHAFHLGHFSTGFVALADKDRVKSMAQLGQPVGCDDSFQNDEAVGVQCVVLRGRQRLGDEASLQQFAVQSGCSSDFLICRGGL